MEHFQRPPLAPLVADEISELMDQIDKRYWPLIIAFRVAKFIPPDIPVPRQRPHQLIELFKSYAIELFVAEASHYGTFRSDRLYVTWLSNLNNRIAVHLQKVFQQLEDGNPNATLLFHGVNYLRIDADVREAMLRTANDYSLLNTGAALPSLQVSEDKPDSATVPRDAVTQLASVRKSMRDTYRAAFPSAGILDICWSAEQHYREWARWLKGELKNDSKPGRAFRKVLTGGQDARTIRKLQRPKGWK
jgi:hypothetical protein